MKRKLLLILALVFSTIQLNAQLAGNSLHFDGTDDHVISSLPNVFNAIGSNDFTIEMWVNQESSQFCRLVFAQFDTDNFACVSLNSTNEVVFYLMENATNHSIQTSDAITNGQWTHIAVTWNSASDETKIYIDGVEASYTAGLYISSTGIDNAMSLGSKTDGSQNYNGEIDEVSIWDVTRTDCDIALNLFDKREGTEANLVTQYGFDHGTAFSPNPGIDELTDLTGNLNDGTLTNFNLAGASSNWFASAVQIVGLISDPVGITLNGTSLSPNVTADQYQWVNCADNSSVPGATNLNFDPTSDDPTYTGAATEYAVILSVGSCFEISECFLYDFTSTEELAFSEIPSVYPNPVQESLTVKATAGTVITVTNMYGQKVGDFECTSDVTTFDWSTFESGTYIIHFSNINHESRVMRCVKL